MLTSGEAPQFCLGGYKEEHWIRLRGHPSGCFTLQVGCPQWKLELMVCPGGSHRWRFGNELEESCSTAAVLLQQRNLMSVFDVQQTER